LLTYLNKQTNKQTGDKSLWKPYFDILPSVEDVNPAYIWSDQELDMLVGSPTYHAAKSLRFVYILIKIKNKKNASH